MEQEYKFKLEMAQIQKEKELAEAREKALLEAEAKATEEAERIKREA